MTDTRMYGKDKKGGYKIWDVTILDKGDHAIIKIEHGKEGGAMQEQITTVTKGKQGRGVYEQAVSEAQGKIKKQYDKGYRYNKEDLEELPLLAMLAADYRKQGHRIQYPCFTSVKYDGVRCVAKCVQKLSGIDILLESRTGQQYDIPHVKEALRAVMKPGEVLDGEIYKHGYALQDIVSAVKRTDTQKEVDKTFKTYDKNPSADNHAEYQEALKIDMLRPQLEFHVFDMPSEETFDVRMNLMQYYMASRVSFTHPFIVTTHYEIAHSEEEMKAQHKDAVAKGYEGIMLRNYSGVYESGKRSADLQKYKEFLDSEFEIVGWTTDKEGLIVFQCQNDLNDKQFSVIIGTQEQKATWVSIADQFIGKQITVKYQSRYKDTLLPQFPVGVAIRDYD